MSQARYIPSYTVEDFQRWEGDWELWQGVPVSMSPAPNRQHQRLAKRLLMLLEQALAEHDDCDCEALYEVDWHLDKNTVVRPDLLIECEPSELPVVAKPPSLCVEVLSPSTADKDRHAKRALYAEQGVGWYLLADPDTKSLQALRLIDGEYTEAPGPVLDMELQPGCVITLDCGPLFG